MTDRYVYLYRITLSKEGEDPLYYFGIRYGFEGIPEDDNYMGSPQTYKSFWDDISYTKVKEVLKVGKVESRDDIDSFAELESSMIKEAWDTYGLYHKGGRCLNMAAGRLYIHTEETRKEIARKCSEYWTGNPEHPMKRPDVSAKQSKSMSRFLLDNPDRNPNNLPGVKEKQRERLLKDNPMHRPEIRAKVVGENNPMYGKKHSEEDRRRISQSVKKAHSNPDVKKKLSDAAKQRWDDDEYKKKLSEKFKKRWEERKRNPVEIEKIRQSCKKGYETRMRNKYKNSLENYFE